jgi:2-methylaconitate cis-trans-isomerase PrpF
MAEEFIRIPCVLMRGGTSKGPFFLASDLPRDPETRDAVLLAIMGSPHLLQVDGIGGAYPQTSKVAIISRAADDRADIDYLFAQVSVDQAIVDTTPNCGNMLAGVGPFAIEAGLWPARDGETTLRVHNVNTGVIVEQTVQTPGGRVTYAGNQAIPGVAGTAAPIKMSFIDAAGSVTGRLLPSGKPSEEIGGLEVSLIDYAMPMMLLRAADVGLTGGESAESIDANRALFARLEPMRREAGRRMGLGDVTDLVVPKIGLLSASAQAGAIRSRYLVPHSCHKSHAATGACCVAAAAAVPGSIAADLFGGALTRSGLVLIEHPAGFMEVVIALEADADGVPRLRRAATVRTARRLFEGHVLCPAAVWPGRIACGRAERREEAT